MTSNMMKLAIRKFSKDAIPAGGGIIDGINAIKGLANGAPKMKEAMAWAKDAVDAIRNAPNPNPFKHQTDEELAAIIIDKIENSASQRDTQKPA